MDIYEFLGGKLNELLDGIDGGDFDDPAKIPEKYTYAHLWALYVFARSLDGGEDMYRNLHELVSRCAISAVKEQIKKGKRIRVVFEMISASEWSAESLYRLLERDERFDTAVMLCPLADRSRDSRLSTYEKMRDFFGKNYNILEGYDKDGDRPISYEELGEKPDIVIHNTSWFESLYMEHSMISFPLRSLHICVLYCMLVADNTEASYAGNNGVNKNIQNMVFRTYADTVKNTEDFNKYQMLKGANVRFSGYPKMDELYSSKRYSENELRSLWKVPEGQDINVIKKVIIAPHFTVLNSGVIHFSTFAKNMYFFLYLAEKYRNCISFVFKPHPNLRNQVVKTGLFPNSDAYDEYLRAWDMLPNSRVVEESTYTDLFATSDGMIMDSSSFIAEYLFVNKPLLFLTRPEQAWNSLGRQLIEAHYRLPGEDYNGIEAFLNNVILDGQDVRMENRERIFKEELDYYGKNGCLAGEFIYNDLCQELFTRTNC